MGGEDDWEEEAVCSPGARGSEVQEATSEFWAFEFQFLILGLAQREGRGRVRTVARGGLIGLGFYG